MEANWYTDFSPELQTALLARLTEVSSSFNSQGMSNTVYAVGELQLQLSKCNVQVQETIYNIALTRFKQKNRNDKHLGQHIANIALGLTNMGAKV